MAGIYIHIPYCRKACHYCNFHFSTSLKSKNEFVPALLKEIELRKDFLPDQDIATIYFGGGTPSLLELNELSAILQTLKKHFNVTEPAEITLEANPDDIRPEIVRQWVELGVNRLSIGIQSFFEEDLQWMNRLHNANQAKDCIRIAQENGISNLTIDLIYGTPGLSDEKWQHNLQTVNELGIQHVSCYALTVEPKTALDSMIAKGKKENIDPEQQASQFMQLMEWSEKNGFEHYEISNFAKPGFRSRHNSAYWSGSHYLGLGPSAHSFNGLGRQWNISNNALYIQSMEAGIIPFEEEILTETQRINEYIMTSLRTLEGLDLHKLEPGFQKTVLSSADKYFADGKMVRTNDQLILTKTGRLYADGIAADLFID
jgi:oxygen-independent coproporphyrinogen III oxidase